MPLLQATGARRDMPFHHPAATAPIKVLGYFDDGFPAALREIPDPPLVLYYMGNLDWLGKPVIAVVGARRATSLGRMVARDMGREFAKFGVHVVSGLAYGIDVAAHQGALEALDAGYVQGGTSAVLGSGLAQVYPQRHASVVRRLCAGGGG